MLVLKSMMKMLGGTRGGRRLGPKSHLDLHYPPTSPLLLILRHQVLAFQRVQHLECR